MTILKTIGQSPLCLDQIFKAVSMLPLTSVEAEKAVCATGLFVTKMQLSLSKNSIDILCFFRHYLFKFNWNMIFDKMIHCETHLYTIMW